METDDGRIVWSGYTKLQEVLISLQIVVLSRTVKTTDN